MRRKPRCPFCRSKKVDTKFGDRTCWDCGVRWGKSGMETMGRKRDGELEGTWRAWRDKPAGTLLVLDKFSWEEDR